MSRGIIAIGSTRRRTVAARITDGSQIVFLVRTWCMAIRFDKNDVRSMGRPAYGVRGIDLAKNDYVVAWRLRPRSMSQATTGFCHHGNGFGKRTNVEMYRLQTAAARA